MTITPVTLELTQRSVDKIDLLFMIDDSASMADKQEYLKLAIPDLIHRLVSPNCVDDDDNLLGPSSLDAKGIATCNKGNLEFPPVHDLHIGVVSSSLGSHGGDQCVTTGNDRGRLITRTGSGATIAETSPSGFLAFQPDVPENAGKPAPQGATAIKKSQALVDDFQDMISGVGEGGCGLEGQLESWYRFLIQPDPYQEIKSGGVLDGVDAVVLKQRHDFLRPDSLVAIIDVTDENDSEIDVRWGDHYGSRFYTDSYGGWTPAHATAACATAPMGPDCHSCDEKGFESQPGCNARYSGDAGNISDYDNMNLRHVHMRQRFGLDPQFPLTRYVNGLREQKVPNRDGEYPSGATSYRGNANCTNPLFAASLPDGTDTSPEALCDLPVGDPKNGGRRPEMVIYAHIGGVPYQLLLDSRSGAPKSTLTEADWQKILGRDPEKYDFSGIDPHMIESMTPRDGLAGPKSADNADPIHGREWDTSKDGAGSDLEYACTFDLPQPKDCTGTGKGLGCDCPTDPGKVPSALPPLCDPAKPTLQTKAKTYPTIRELLLAKKMGGQGVAASLCPIHAKDNATNSDPLYGYRPAVTAIVDTIKRGFINQCVPHKIVRKPGDTKDPCLALEVEPKAGTEEACGAIAGRSQLDAEALSRFLKDHTEATGHPVCVVAEVSGENGATCRHSSEAGWCYVEGAAAPGSCSQAIQFSNTGTPPEGAEIVIQCLEEAQLPGDD